jgi:hypothetical protein
MAHAAPIAGKRAVDVSLCMEMIGYGACTHWLGKYGGVVPRQLGPTPYKTAGELVEAGVAFIEGFPDIGSLKLTGYDADDPDRFRIADTIREFVRPLFKTLIPLANRYSPLDKANEDLYEIVCRWWTARQNVEG